MTEHTGKQPAAPAKPATPRISLSLILGLIAIAAALIVTHGSVVTEMFSRKSVEDLMFLQSWEGFWAKGVWTWVLIGGALGVRSWARGPHA